MSVEVLAGYGEILRGEGVSFLKEVDENFNRRGKELVQKGVEKEKRIDGGEFGRFL